jgi:serine/threonine-protein kinase HipA
MSTSTSDVVYVWAWPSGETEPVPVGVLRSRGDDGLWFTYGRRWLERAGSFALGPDLPLGTRDFEPHGDLRMPGSIRDAAPDSWGQLLITDRIVGDRNRDPNTIDPQVFLLNSGSNRLGALDFQASADDYVSRDDDAALAQLQEAADLIIAGEVLPPQLAAAALHGTSMGGARPKATIRTSDGEWLAKFSTSRDTYDVIHAEAMGIALARRVGIDVPEFKLVASMGRDVLLARRFDRGAGGTRRPVVSGLTILALDESTWRDGSYPSLVDAIRLRSERPGEIAERIFQRVAFNIAIRNNDDHLRNHAAFWDGQHLELTPAYDLSPAPTSGETAGQALAYGREGQRNSSFRDVVAVAADYGLSNRRAREIVNHVIDTIADTWNEAADEAELSRRDRSSFQGWLFLNPGTLNGYTPVDPAGPPVKTSGNRPGRSLDRGRFDFRRFIDDAAGSSDEVSAIDAREQYGLGFQDLAAIVGRGESGARLDDLGELRIPTSALAGGPTGAAGSTPADR